MKCETPNRRRAATRETRGARGPDRRAARRRRPRTSRPIALAVAALAGLALLAPTGPAEAYCEACWVDFGCTGTDCWPYETCEENFGRGFEICWIDQFGLCHDAGDVCLYA